MDHIIVRETASEMRAIARKALRGNWKNFALVMALYYLLMITLPLIMDELLPSATISQLDELTGETVELPIISSLYSLLLSGPFTMGLASFALYYFRRKELHAGHLFDGFEVFLKAVFLAFVQGFYIFLWSLLLVVPGIIAALRYSQAYYILADHPEYSINQCMELSKQYMNGNKGKLFCFELSFIGWLILASLAVMPLEFVSLSGIPYILGDYILSIPHFFYLAYNSVGMIVFYELVSGNLMAKPSQPIENCGIPVMVESPTETPTDEKKDEFDF